MLSKVHNLIQVSELRSNLAKYLRLSSSEPVAISAGRNVGARVLLDSELYNQLVEAYEDKCDTELLQTLQSESSEVVGWSVVKAKHGL